WVSKPRADLGMQRLAEDDRAYLFQVAEDTWRFFEAVVGPEDHHLPPDNLQCEPDMVVAHRTSPPNMGLYLLSVCCARQFGWIDTPTMARRLEATLTTMGNPPRHRGHSYNGYDTQRLVILPPAYVSTVDSGNLSACLLSVAQACQALRSGTHDAVGDQGLRTRLERIAERCQ